MSDFCSTPNGRGIPIRVGQGNIGGPVQIRALHADVLQGHWRAVALGQIKQGGGGTGFARDAQGEFNAVHGLRRGLGIEGQGLRQDDRVNLGMGEAVTSHQPVYG